MEYPKHRQLPLRERRPSWLQQGGHYFFRLWSLSLSRKASNAITKLPKVISKPITPMNIIMISAAVIGATSLPMYSGKPVIGSGGYHPCHGFHEWILPQYDRNFNSGLLAGNKSTNLISECHISVTEKAKMTEVLILSDFQSKCPLFELDKIKAILFNNYYQLYLCIFQLF